MYHGIVAGMDALHYFAVVQHEISLDAYNTLTKTPDAKGRKIQVIKVPTPYPMFRTYREADSVHVSCCPCL